MKEFFILRIAVHVAKVGKVRQHPRAFDPGCEFLQRMPTYGVNISHDVGYWFFLFQHNIPW